MSPNAGAKTLARCTAWQAEARARTQSFPDESVQIRQWEMASEEAEAANAKSKAGTYRRLYDMGEIAAELATDQFWLAERN